MLDVMRLGLTDFLPDILDIICFCEYLYINRQFVLD